MDTQQRKQYNHQYYMSHKDKIKALKKLKQHTPYNHLSESHKRASRNYYWRKKERQTDEERLDILSKRREAYAKKKHGNKTVQKLAKV